LAPSLQVTFLSRRLKIISAGVSSPPLIAFQKDTHYGWKFVERILWNSHRRTVPPWMKCLSFPSLVTTGFFFKISFYQPKTSPPPPVSLAEIRTPPFCPRESFFLLRRPSSFFPHVLEIPTSESPFGVFDHPVPSFGNSFPGDTSLFLVGFAYLAHPCPRTSYFFW